MRLQRHSQDSQDHQCPLDDPQATRTQSPPQEKNKVRILYVLYCEMNSVELRGAVNIVSRLKIKTVLDGQNSCFTKSTNY